jgi:hypothetical protein
MRHSEKVTTNKTADGGLLYITDLIGESDEALDNAFDLAARHGVTLELVHIVDLEHSISSPDAQMGIQFRLDSMAQQLRHLKRNVASILLFGTPEDLICHRAWEIGAKLIAFAQSSGPSRAARDGMIQRVQRKVACPVVILPACVS